MLVKLKIFRFDPQKDREPYYQSFNVEAGPMERLLDCLNRIRWEQDPTLSFRWSCGHGVCGSDGMRINGICGLPCQKLVKNFQEEVLIEPFPVFKVIKDLVVDLAPFLEKYHSIKPYLVTKTRAPEKERIQLRVLQKSKRRLKRLSAASSVDAAPPHAQSIKTLRQQPMLDRLHSFEPSDTSSIQGMKHPKKESPYLTTRMEPGVARLYGNVRKSVPRRSL
jgi:succinate dehydrogenase / fumarate reductase iron-sulfur subunit